MTTSCCRRSTPGKKDWSLARRLLRALRRSRPPRRGRRRDVRRPRARQGGVDGRQREPRGVRVIWDDVRRAERSSSSSRSRSSAPTSRSAIPARPASAQLIVGAYCLSESGSGSGRARRRRSPVRQADGGFVLNGEKMWITNGGFADVFIVFAKVMTSGEQFTAFIVERAFPGVAAARKNTRWAFTARRRHRCAAGRAVPATTSSARSARDTRSRSTC